VFSMSMSSVSVNLGILEFEGIVPEVDASLVISLKWAPYDILLLFDSFRDFWYSSTKCLGVRHFLAKWFGPPYLWHVNVLPCLAFAFPLTFGHVLHVLVVVFTFLKFTKFLVLDPSPFSLLFTL
jgi:hypothetical protein